MKNAILIGAASALQSYHPLKELKESTTAPNSKPKLVTGETGFADYECASFMRIQGTSSTNLFAKDLFGSYATAAALATEQAKNYLCIQSIFDDSTKQGFCTAVHGTGNAAATINTGFFVYLGVFTTNAGDKVAGVPACSTSKDVCVGDKFVSIADKAAGAAKEVILKIVDHKQACSTLIEAKCDAPWVQLSGGTSYDATNAVKLSYSVVEWETATGNVWTSAEATKVVAGKPTTLTQLSTANIQLFLKNQAADPTANPGAASNQGQTSKTVKLQQFKSDTNGRSVPAHLVWQFFSIKLAEYKTFNTDKAAYETKKTDYNTKLDAAEKLVKDTLSKDIFRLASPQAADKTILNAVPVRPMNPSVPAAYAGPTKALAATSGQAANTFVIDSNGKWDKVILSDFSDVQESDGNAQTGKEAINLVTGKSFGTYGFGTNTGTTAVVADDAKTIGLGITYLAKTEATTPVCIPHYMMFQAGPKLIAYADAGKTQKWKYGVNEFQTYFDVSMTAPTAAADPKIPSTGAAMLATSVASLAVAMTLF